MLKWEKIDYSTKIACAFPCINRGIIDDTRKHIDLPARIYANDALMLVTSIEHMKMVLAAMIETNFFVVGKLYEKVWQCPLTMNK
jgi:hypothetical protein